MRRIRQAAEAKAKRGTWFQRARERFAFPKRYYSGGEVPKQNGVYEGPTASDWKRNNFAGVPVLTGLVNTDEVLKYFKIPPSGPHTLGQSLAQTYAIRHNNEAIRRAFGVPDALSEGYYPDDDPSRGDA